MGAGVIGPVTEYALLGSQGKTRTSDPYAVLDAKARDALPSGRVIDEIVEQHAVPLGIRFQSGQANGHYFVIDGRRHTRIPFYALAEPHEVVEAAKRIVEAIAQRFGPGRVWTLNTDARVHIVKDDGVLWAEDWDGKRHYRMRAFVVHENGPHLP